MKPLAKLCLAAALALPAATALADLNIGVILSQTGPGASLGIPARHTVDLWPREIAGQKLNITVLDDRSDPTVAATAARQLIEDRKVDIIIGPSITPTSLSALQAAGEAKTPIFTLAGGKSIVEPLEGARTWAFKMPPDEAIPVKLILQHMQKNGQKRLATVAVANSYGQVFVDVMRAMAPEFGVEIVGAESFNPTDTSFVAQALKLLAARPDAIFIAAVGTPGAMPHVELVQRGFKGQIYQTQAIANNDFLRIGGKALDGALFPVSPLLVAEQLPDSNPVKAAAVDYVQRYENAHGPGSRSLFGAMAWDAMAFVEHAVPQALAKAQPGTSAFREALRDAIEQTQELVVSQGVYSLSPTNHNGADERSQVMVRIHGGGWQYAGE